MISRFSIPVTTIIFAIVLFILSLNIPKPRNVVIAGAEFWPILISILLFLTGLALLVKELKDRAKSRELVEGDPDLVYPHRLWLIILLITGYVLVVEFLGFILSTFILMLIGIRLIEKRRFPFVILVSLVATVFFIVTFAVFLTLPLPRGIGLLRELSFFVY